MIRRPQTYVGPAALLILAFLPSFVSPSSMAASSMASNNPPVVRDAVQFDTSPLLKEMTPIPPRKAEADDAEKLQRRPLPRGTYSSSPGQGGSGSSGGIPIARSPDLVQSFEGIGNVNGVLPPDPVGDIGPNNYVEMVNLSFAVFNRSGSLLYGPVDTSTLWQGFGGACQTSNDGDGIVLYDHQADRWLMSQFALPNFPNGPFYQCIAVSQTSDPTGAWYRYQFLISNTKLNDYPKFGVWPDGYYLSVNQFNCNFLGCFSAGAGVASFERDKMLNGQSAQMVYFDMQSTHPELGGMLPADLDGPPPPAATPNPFVQVDDNAWGYPADQLEVWEFSVDWSSPSASTFTSAGTLPTNSFDSNLCNYSRNCIKQPGGSALDAIADQLMFRLAFRDFGDHQSLVVNHTVDTNGADRAGIRWYELRNSGGGWSIYQQGTYAPADRASRWMGSVAMNGAGDIAIGYSMSSRGIYPSVRFTGRQAADPLGQMTTAEGEIIAGSGYQTSSSGRWGDYSALTIDPVDDCTFWYVQEYYAVVGGAPWQTRIGAFRISKCGTSPTPTSTPGTQTLTPTATSTPGGRNTPTPNLTPTMTQRQTPTSTGMPTATQAATNTPSSGTLTHIGDLDGHGQSMRNGWVAEVSVTVHDATHGPLGGAEVTGIWSSGVPSTVMCKADSSGICTVATGVFSPAQSSVTFTVVDVSGRSIVYDPASNHDGEGDSNGTVITVVSP